MIEKGEISFDYINIPNIVPMVSIDPMIILVGGFYDGNLQIIFISVPKYSGILQLPMKTVTALAYDTEYKFLYIGDSTGYLGVYELSYTKKDVDFV